MHVYSFHQEQLDSSLPMNPCSPRTSTPVLGILRTNSVQPEQVAAVQLLLSPVGQRSRLVVDLSTQPLLSCHCTVDHAGISCLVHFQPLPTTPPRRLVTSIGTHSI